MINVVNLNKYYNKNKSNEIHVINNTNLVLPNTGFVVFLGASGSGKTTLINVIAGLDKAKGEISYDEATFKNYKMNKIDKYRRDNIGYVFQNYNLLPNMSVYDNLRLPLELMGIVDNSIIKERITYVLDKLNIKKCMNKLASNLSGGQMQRVSIARALIKDSKIIIADEPTGNLDSENTIEVMNILKSISKNRLVIMVTHDRKNANFYADRIIEIKDGVIDKDYENNSSDTLDNYDKTKIYLKDLKNEVIDINNVKLNLYLEDGDMLNDLNLTIVKKDGIVYLKSDNVKFLSSDSKVQLIDDNYKSIKKEDIDNYEFDLKPIEKKKKKFSLMPLWHSLADAYSTHRASSKKMKGLHVCFVLIGVVMAICVLMMSVGTYVKDDQLDFSDIGITYKRGDVRNYYVEAKKLVDEGLIIDYTDSSIGTYTSNIAGNVNLTNACYNLNYKYINDSVIEGVNECNSDEVIISKRIADSIIKKMSNYGELTYKSLIGNTFNNKKIVGIVDNLSTSYYTTNTSSSRRYNIESYGISDINEVSFEYISNIDYEIVGGRNIENNDEVLMDVVTYMKKYSNKQTIEIDGTIYSIVGLFNTDSDNVPTLLTSDIILAQRNFKKYFYNGLVKASKLNIVEGRSPIGSNEIVVSKCYAEGLNLEFDQLIKDNDYKIVGKFDSNYSHIITTIGMDDNFVLYQDIRYPSNSRVLITKDDNLVIERFKSVNSTFKTSYDLDHDLKVKQKKEMFGSTITVSLVFLVITIIYTFFMMRSKMIHRIYEIGVLREIGASKYRIYRMFFVELIVLIFMTTMIGYLGSLLLCHFANSKIHGILNLFRYSPIYAIIGFFILLIVSVASGMLPIFTLQRKTPAEIVAKYDL